MKPWFGKLVYSREGVETYHEFETESEAKAYALGIQDAIEIAEQDTNNPLEDYFGCYDQDEPKDE